MGRFFNTAHMFEGFQSGAVADPDPLGTNLAALDAASKLVCAWYLPAASPSSPLTLVGADVTLWVASYGSQKVSLAGVTGVSAPQWDATLFSNKGGVTFNGTTQFVEGTGNVVNWPTSTDDFYMLAGARNDSVGGFRRGFSFGDAGTSSRNLGVNGTAISMLVGATSVAGSGSTAGANTVGAFVDMGGTSAVYLNGSSDGTASTASGNLTLTRVRLGANANASPTQFWSGAIVCAAILNSTASLSDFTTLEALIRARLS